MHVVEVGRQTSDELSVTGDSQLNPDEADSERLLTGSSARGAVPELCTGQSEVSTSGDHDIPLQAWYQQPKQECIRCDRHQPAATLCLRVACIQV